MRSRISAKFHGTFYNGDEVDGESHLRQPGRLGVAMRAVFHKHNPRLANDRLAALYRIAVLGWHHGSTVPSRKPKHPSRQVSSTD